MKVAGPKKDNIVGPEAKPGDRVMYAGATPSQITGHDDPRGLIEIGEILIIEGTVTHSWSTDLIFREIDGEFNSVCFKKVDQSFVNGLTK